MYDGAKIAISAGALDRYNETFQIPSGARPGEDYLNARVSRDGHDNMTERGEWMDAVDEGQTTIAIGGCLVLGLVLSCILTGVGAMLWWVLQQGMAVAA